MGVRNTSLVHTVYTRDIIIDDDRAIDIPRTGKQIATQEKERDLIRSPFSQFTSIFPCSKEAEEVVELNLRVLLPTLHLTAYSLSVFLHAELIHWPRQHSDYQRRAFERP